MPSAKFTLETAKRVLAATRKVERMPTDKDGGRAHRLPPEPQFWAMLTSAGGLNGLHWSWVKAMPVAELPTAADPFTTADVPLFTLAEPHVVGFDSAREANLNRQIEPGTVVRLEFVGYDREGEPAYVFNHGQPREADPIPIHDHRDNFNGGFAFSVYHPGTALPQQPFAV
jgi:hypothetical protein